MTLYNYTIANYIKNLGNMKALLTKAEVWAKENAMTEEQLLGSRLAPDQFPFIKQIQIMSDSAKSSGAVLAHIAIPSFEDTETTVEQLKERVTKTVDFLKTITPEMIDESTLTTRTVPIKWIPGKGFTAYDHSAVYALPNFFFHYTTAYSILRHIGVPLGKADYMGELPFVDVV